jgi:hypothetical protein
LTGRQLRFAGAAWWVVVAALAFVAASAALRLALSDNLQPDDAELVVASQTVRGGYTEQPPLYTWMLWGTFQATGPGLLGHAIVRGALLLTLILLTYLTARHLVPDRRLHAMLTFSALLLPAYGWHAATYLTHSLLLGVAVMTTVYATARVIRDGHTLDYLFLGAAIAVGILAKYNFPLVIAAAVAAAASLPAARKRLLDRRMFLAAGFAIALLLPHLLWLSERWEDVYRLVRSKADRAESPPYWVGVARGLWAFVVCLAGCVFLVAPLLAWLGRRAARIDSAEPATAWLGRFLLAMAGIHLALVFVLGVTRFQDRWVQPLLLPLPIWYLARFVPATIPAGRIRVLAWVTAALAAGILAGQAAQIAIVERLPGRYGLDLDYPRLARELDAAGYGDATFVAVDREVIGNLVPHLPRATMHYCGGVEPFQPPDGVVVVIWDEERGAYPPLVLMPDVAAGYPAFNVRAAAVRKFPLVSRGGAGSAVTVCVCVLTRVQPRHSGK